MQNKEQLRQQKLAMIEDWQHSSLSQKQYCLEHDIAYHIFHYWYKQSRTKKAGDAADSSPFVKLVTPSLATGIHTELLLPDGKRLLFHQPVSSVYLKTLID